MSIHTPLDSSLATVKAQTRAERRRIRKEQAKSKAVYTMTREQLDAYVIEAVNKANEEANKQVQEIKTTMLNTAITCIESALCVVLHDKLGYGKVRIQRIVDELENQLDCIIHNTVTLEDLEQLKEELLGKSKYDVFQKAE